jgi:hypothetical protein
MLDLILAPLLEYTNLGKYTHKVEKDGKSKEELWYSSATNITFGDSNTWLIGLGRTTNICGPEIKVVADWTFIEELISKKMEHYPITQALLFGVGGASDVLFGVKNLINYGDTQDATVIRKQTAPLEIKIFKGESLFPTDLVLLIVLPYLLLLTMVVTIRFANMQVGVFAEESTREKVAKALSVLAPLVESRWIALLLVYEKLTYTADELKKVKDKITAKIAELQKAIAAGAEKIKATGVNSILPEATKNDLKHSILVCKRDIFIIKDHEEADLKSATDVLATLLKKGDISQEYKTSNTGLASSYKWLSYDAEKTIYLSVGNPPKYSSMQLNPKSIEMKLVSDKGKNTATLNLSETANDGGKVDIKCSGDDGYINLETAGNDLAKLNISKNTVLIQGGSDNTKNPLIKLEDDKITLRCGTVVTNPEILITDTEVKIKVGAPEIGSLFVMTKDSIELKVGPLSALKITSAGIEIKSGEATSTKWSPTSINMAAAETKMRLDLMKIQQNAIILKQNAVLQAEIKAMLLMLKGAPALKLDAIIKSL